MYLIPGLLFGYLFGSCPTGYILTRLMTGEDIRQFGSGNIGATNVGRVLGKKWGIFTAVFDMLKGWLAMLLVSTVRGAEDPAAIAAVGFAAVLGHDYPIWLWFKGGKGVATTFGVVACFGIWPAILGGAVWATLRELTRYVSISSLVGLAVSSLTLWMFDHPTEYVVASVLLLVLTAIRHKDNIIRLINGTENKIERMYPKLLAKIKRRYKLR